LAQSCDAFGDKGVPLDALIPPIGGGKTTKLRTADEAIRERIKRVAIAGIHGAA
jgi:hypothetical protein